MRAFFGLAAVAVVFVALSGPDSQGQERKNYKDLDADAQRLFRDGKYAEAHKVWRYIHNDYPRAEFRDLPEGDPRFVAWQNAFHTAIVREGLAQKHVLLQSDDPAKKGRAEAAFTQGVNDAREMMRRVGVPKAAQDRLIKAAVDPLVGKPEEKAEPKKK